MADGFLFTSNVDGAGNDDPDNEQDAVASLAGGPHYLSTDFPAPVPGQTYFLEIPGGQPARCNPVSAPDECTPQAIESLSN